MKKETKKAVRNILIGCVLGILIICVGALLGGQFGFSIQIAWNEVTREANENYTAAADVQSVAIQAESGEVTVRTADVERATIGYFADDRVTVRVAEENGALTVVQELENKFFASYGGEITVTLPADGTYTVEIMLDAGKLTLNGLQADRVNAALDVGDIVYENCTADTASLNIDAGKLSLQNAAAVSLQAGVNAGRIEGTNVRTDRATLVVDVGNISLQVVGTKSEYTLTGGVALGSCNFTNQTGTTEKFITANVDAGSIDLVFAAA